MVCGDAGVLQRVPEALKRSKAEAAVCHESQQVPGMPVFDPVP